MDFIPTLANSSYADWKIFQLMQKGKENWDAHDWETYKYLTGKEEK